MIKFILLAAIIVGLVANVRGSDNHSSLHPIVLIPGDGGSQLNAKLDKPEVVHYLCTKKTDDYFNIWLNLELLVPLIIDCWIDNVRLVYNFTTRTTENSPGVDIQVPGFGNTSSVEFLDPSHASPGIPMFGYTNGKERYFPCSCIRLVEQSLLPMGYTRNVDIRGAPYDFRKAPNEMQDWFKQFKYLIEETYVQSGNKSVVLISHSMGGPLGLYFLHKYTTSKWKDQYIRAFITLAAPWGGSVKAWKVFAAGDDLGVYVLPSHTMRGMQRTSPSTAFLLPSGHLWRNDEVIVSCPGKGNYTINDFERFFNDMNFRAGYEMYLDTKDLMGSLDPPEVELHCLHGQGVSTVETMTYKEEKYFPGSPTLSMGNGDGTVNIRSLRYCTTWDKAQYRAAQSNKRVWKKSGHKFKKYTVKDNIERGANSFQKQVVYHEEYPGVDHSQILSDKRAIQYITQALKRINS